MSISEKKVLASIDLLETGVNEISPAPPLFPFDEQPFSRDKLTKIHNVVVEFMSRLEALIMRFEPRFYRMCHTRLENLLEEITTKLDRPPHINL